MYGIYFSQAKGLHSVVLGYYSLHITYSFMLNLYSDFLMKEVVSACTETNTAQHICIPSKYLGFFGNIPKFRPTCRDPGVSIKHPGYSWSNLEFRPPSQDNGSCGKKPTFSCQTGLSVRMFCCCTACCSCCIVQ